MQAIRVEALSKTFQVRRKEKGLRGSVQAILRPRTEEVRAVREVYRAERCGEEHYDQDADGYSLSGRRAGNGAGN